MKFSRIFSVSFCFITFVMDTLPHKSDHNNLRSILDAHSAGYASFVENRHRFLKIQHIRGDPVYDSMECALNCLVTVRCRSFNFRLQADTEGKHLCELLASDKFHHSKHFEPSAEYHHYSIPNPCEYAPCLHGFTCHPLYETHGFVCRCVPGYIGEVCDIKVPCWLKVNINEVCFGARGDSYGAFTMPLNGSIASVKLAHLRGKVSCARFENIRYSYWGCAVGETLATFVTGDNNTVVFPQISKLKAYTLPGMRSDSPELTFNNLSVPLRVVSGQEFRVWYVEDLRGVSEDDNGGETCMDIYALYI